MHPSEHGLSAIIAPQKGEPLLITGPSPYIDTTEPFPAYCGTLRTPKGWWGIVIHCPRGMHPQEAVQHFEREPAPVNWCGMHANIGLYRKPTNELVVSARILPRGLEEMTRLIAEDKGYEFAETRFVKRRVPAGVRYLPGRQLQLWFSL